MTRNIHDSFAKEWMQEMLSDFGQVEVEKAVPGEVHTIDVVFQPDPTAIPNLKPLGLFGRMVAKPSLIEPFRNAVPEWEICNCRYKLFGLRAELRRRAKAKKQKARTQKAKKQKVRDQAGYQPFLWILSPTLSARMQAEFCMKQKPKWGEGVHFLPNPDRTAIIAIHQLPKTLDTLWLRLLGRDQIQAAAIAELLALPTQHPYRQETMKHLAVLQINLRVRQNKTKDQREVIMNLAPVYEKWREETLTEGKQEGRQEGRQEERRSLALKMLEANAAVEFVAQITGYSIAEIQQLQAK
jgi:hypothetical protein